MSYPTILKQPISNRGVPADSFMDQIISALKALPDEVFAERPDAPGRNTDIYTKVFHKLGPYRRGIPQATNVRRRSVMALVLITLGMFESSGNWNESTDVTNPAENSEETRSAGAFQISADSQPFGADLREMCSNLGIHTATKFRHDMMVNHPFAVEYTARLLRHTDEHNGPVRDNKMDQWLTSAKVDALEQFFA